MDSRFKLHEEDLRAAFEAGAKWGRNPDHSDSFRHWLAVQECHASFDLFKNPPKEVPEVTEDDIF